LIIGFPFTKMDQKKSSCRQVDSQEPEKSSPRRTMCDSFYHVWQEIGCPLGCVYCKHADHKSFDCNKFTDPTQRRKILIQKRLCFIAPNLITERPTAKAEERVGIVRGVVTLPFLIEKLLRRLWHCCETSPFRCSKGRDDIRHSQVYWIKTKSATSDFKRKQTWWKLTNRSWWRSKTSGTKDF